MISRINRLRAKKGFTMVELIVVIAIIGVLTAMIVPSLTYSNKPALGKGIAKDLFYKAQDVFSSARVAYPAAVSSGSNVTYFADINGQGDVTGCGSLTKASSPNADGTVSITLTKTYFAAALNVTPTSSDSDKLNNKVKEMFETYLERTDNMEGSLYIVADDHYRVRVAYWTDASDFAGGGGSFVDNCILGNGAYCCAFPVALCDPGATMFPTFS